MGPGGRLVFFFPHFVPLKNQVIPQICGQQPGCRWIVHDVTDVFFFVFLSADARFQVQNAFQNMKVESTKSTDE